MEQIDEKGFRLNVGIILLNDEKKVFLASRVGANTWQLPQGGINKGESFKAAMYRELFEEVGLTADNVEIIASTKGWLSYKFPKKYIKYNQNPLCIGQKQRWFLLKLLVEDSFIDLNTQKTPEFDDYCWVNYWDPKDIVINFKKKVYNRALKELYSFIS